MKIYEEKPITKVEMTLTKTICDVCKKEINTDDNYYEVTESHHDWGNDSFDSIKSKDICSDECLKCEFDDYLAFESDTKQIEIEKV